MAITGGKWQAVLQTGGGNPQVVDLQNILRDPSGLHRAEAEFSNLLEGETNISFLPKPIDIKTLAERVKQELQNAA